VGLWRSDVAREELINGDDKQLAGRGTFEGGGYFKLIAYV